ncbi:MAG: polysaccharide deacetylase family protein [Coriobacteriia bacterium]
MAFLRSQGAEPDGPPPLRAFVATLAVVLAVGFALAAYLPVTVTVDGVRVWERAGTTVAEVVRRHPPAATAGDLLAAADRSVVRAGGGDPSRVLLEGVPVELDARVFEGAALTGVRGADRVEPTETTRVLVPSPVVFKGAGPILQLASPGEAGTAVVVRGTVSRLVVATLSAVPPTPMVFLRKPIDGGTKVVALSFDDGPWPGQTERILDVLRRERVHATFFMVGYRASLASALARRVAREGHTVGNHTQRHVDLGQAGAPLVASEMGRAQKVLLGDTGVEPRWFRPPGGSVSPLIYARSRALDLRLVLWTVDPEDWSRPGAATIVKRVLELVRPGGVVLLHDGGGDRTQTIQALPYIIRGLRARGYSLVTLGQLPGATYRFRSLRR